MVEICVICITRFNEKFEFFEATLVSFLGSMRFYVSSSSRKSFLLKRSSYSFFFFLSNRLLFPDTYVVNYLKNSCYLCNHFVHVHLSRMHISAPHVIVLSFGYRSV